MQQTTHQTHPTHSTYQTFIHPVPATFRLRRNDASDRRGSKVATVSSADEARRLAWEQHGGDIEAALAGLEAQGWQVRGWPGPACIETRQFSRSVLADNLQSGGATLLFGCALTVALTAATGGMFLLVLAGLALTQNEYIETTEFRVDLAR